jgi:hypothetical protein
MQINVRNLACYKLLIIMDMAVTLPHLLWQVSHNNNTPLHQVYIKAVTVMYFQDLQKFLDETKDRVITLPNTKYTLKQ